MIVSIKVTYLFIYLQTGYSNLLELERMMDYLSRKTNGWIGVIANDKYDPTYPLRRYVMSRVWQMADMEDKTVLTQYTILTLVLVKLC